MFVSILNKLPENLNFLISFFFIPFKAEVTNNSELFLPPNAQFVIFFAGNLILCNIFPDILKIEIHAP